MSIPFDSCAAGCLFELYPGYSLHAVEPADVPGEGYFEWCYQVSQNNAVLAVGEKLHLAVLHRMF
ncbi:MAG: hypothetical protein Hals2KO_19820 [Halioglobus sp.]